MLVGPRGAKLPAAPELLLEKLLLPLLLLLLKPLDEGRKLPGCPAEDLEDEPERSTVAPGGGAPGVAKDSPVGTYC